MQPVNRSPIILTLALLAAFGASTRVMAKVHVPEKTASGFFAANYDGNDQADAAETLDFAGRASLCDYELASGQSKWLSRDPIQEEGGMNLYLSMRGDSVNRADYLGLCEYFIATMATAVGNTPFDILPQEQKIIKEIGKKSLEQIIGSLAKSAVSLSEVMAWIAKGSVANMFTVRLYAVYRCGEKCPWKFIQEDIQGNGKGPSSDIYKMPFDLDAAKGDIERIRVAVIAKIQNDCK